MTERKHSSRRSPHPEGGAIYAAKRLKRFKLDPGSMFTDVNYVRDLRKASGGETLIGKAEPFRNRKFITLSVYRPDSICPEYQLLL
jgi:hypothetical protein